MTGVSRGGGGARDDRPAPVLLWDGLVVPGVLAEELVAALDLLEAYGLGTVVASRGRPVRLSRGVWAVREVARGAALRFREVQEVQQACAAATVAVLTPAQPRSQSRPEELTTEQAATILGVTEARVRQLAAAGDIEGRKAARNTWLLSSESVRAYAHRRSGHHGGTHRNGPQGAAGAGAA
ncbi:helix-turn-helix domain-containing protein [Streptomyces sp. BF23-18]|uniref:helix-turn-helix domain-containing protein n=1 Tax=Streptomyces sp. BF23-18 TaxID=3240282 RepID=UPI0034E470A1